MPAFEHQVARIGENRGNAFFLKMRLDDFEFAPSGNFAPIHDGDHRRRSGAAPFAIAGEESGEEQLHQRIFADGVALREALHDRKREKNIGESFGVAWAGGRFGVVFGELQGVGEEKGIEARSGAGGGIARIDAGEALFFGA